ncbi:fatty acid desaturase [Thioalkalivibrio sp. XN8]|uniref:DesA family fatty acid desaturase n=1 Tax=Thioalkalivibrio sp. XN8 TaxID=2712863 RepID=UPI0013ED76E2|nr:fatty acid desaturase [Thioalkalivibrio sp. XN8]NGP53423.1 acyl-CoA desaturase [Thioalkalivibrio sp. XN8]
MDFIVTHYHGLLGLSPLGYVLASLLMLQVTIFAVTLYLHRDAAHRAVDLHPALRHFCRFWLWLTTGISTREWVAIHRKHHARCETADDPHSPQVEGLRKVLLEGAELYRAEAANAETLAKYGRGTPDDWLERKVYSGHTYLGIALMVAAFLLLFGVPGIIMIAVQLVSQPLLAAGIINGVGHYAGYRNFECADASRNITPWGLFVGGEELHNNHHAYPSSARFSIRPWEFDIGWAMLRVLSALGLAKVRRTAPRPTRLPATTEGDLENLRAVVVARMHVMRDYTRQVTLPTLRTELAGLRARLPERAGRLRRLLVRESALLDTAARRRLQEVLAHSQALATVHEFRERLKGIWSGRASSNEVLLAQFREWCAQAEASGIRSLQEFADSLRGYRLRTA